LDLSIQSDLTTSRHRMPTINRECFRLYVERLGDIVIVDNHLAQEPRVASLVPPTRSFFLPKYSPDLNPSDQRTRTGPKVRKLVHRRDPQLNRPRPITVPPADCKC
jgi:transposase